MTKELTFKTTQIGIFNPGRLSDEEIERAFITRKKVLEYLLEGIVTESPDAIPQHYLIIGQRGMGKSTLLHRIAVELRKEKYRAAFIPLTFPEEQYNVDRLSKFWLNCLDALADALDREGSLDELAQLDSDISKLTYDAKAISVMDMYAHLSGWAKRIGKRLVLLVDNLGLIFESLSKEEQHQLRAILMTNGAPILVGASASSITDTVEYGAPFYDAFQVQYLKKLTFDETMDVLRNLAEITNTPAFINELTANRARLRTIYQLTGGTPRTIVMLYPLIQNGFSVEVQNDLEGLMDVMTPLYKARFEELPKQLQVILDAVALHWDPIALDNLRQITQLENSQLSPQLKRLSEVGWIEKLNAYQKKGSAYQISERFFNIWYLMRRSSRRQKKELLCLTKFLVSYYGEELSEIGERALLSKSLYGDQVSMQLAIADGVHDRELATKLRRKSWEDLFEILKSDYAILKNFEIPIEIINKKERELFEKAIKLDATNKWSEALDTCRIIVNINPLNGDAWSFIGYLNKDRLYNNEQAKEALGEAIKIDKSDTFSWNLLGRLYEEDLEDYKKAEYAYLKVLEIDEVDSFTWYLLGDLYREHLIEYTKAEDALIKAAKIRVTDAFLWCTLGKLYQDNLGEYDKAEIAYLEATSIEGKYTSFSWYMLGNLYEENLSEYNKAEESYLKAIENNGEYAQSWFNLGNLYQNHLCKYEESERAYLKVIAIDSQALYAWYELGNLYQYRLGRYEESEDNYLRAIEIDEQYAHPWNGLGNLYQNHLGRYEEAEQAYLTAIKIDEEDVSARMNLIFFYRDKMNRIEVAEEIFKAMEIPDELEDSYWLNASLFELYVANLGIGKQHLLKALEISDGQLSYNTQADWWRYAAVSIRLGHGQAILEVLKENRYDMQLRPYYVAIQSLLVEDSEAFLDSIAVEIREVAADLAELIKHYM